MKETIKHINQTIAAYLNEEKQTIDLRDFGLAESVAMRSEDGEVTFPAIVLPDGEAFDVYGETDKHDVTLYHRLQSISYNEEETSYGSGRIYTQVADMNLLVFGKREAISPFRMEQIARRAIAEQKDATLVGSDFNILQIFANEYIGVTFFMGTAYYLFKINYRITSTYNPRCD